MSSAGGGRVMIGAEWVDTVRSPASVGGANTQRVHVALSGGSTELDSHFRNARDHGAEILAERVRGAVEAKTVTTDDGHEIQVTVSAGVACFDQDMPNPESVVTRADEALYEAKARGRNQVVVAPRLDQASKKAEATAAGSPT